MNVALNCGGSLFVFFLSVFEVLLIRIRAKSFLLSFFLD